VLSGAARLVEDVDGDVPAFKDGELTGEAL